MRRRGLSKLRFSVVFECENYSNPGYSLGKAVYLSAQKGLLTTILPAQ